MACAQNKADTETRCTARATWHFTSGVDDYIVECGFQMEVFSASWCFVELPRGVLPGVILPFTA